MHEQPYFDLDGNQLRVHASLPMSVFDIIYLGWGSVECGRTALNVFNKVLRDTFAPAVNGMQPVYLS